MKYVTLEAYIVGTVDANIWNSWDYLEFTVHMMHCPMHFNGAVMHQYLLLFGGYKVHHTIDKICATQIVLQIRSKKISYKYHGPNRLELWLIISRFFFVLFSICCSILNDFGQDISIKFLWFSPDTLFTYYSQIIWILFTYYSYIIHLQKNQLTVVKLRFIHH